MLSLTSGFEVQVEDFLKKTAVLLIKGPLLENRFLKGYLGN